MPDYLTKGNKTIKCKHCNHSFQVPFQTTVIKCHYCDKTLWVNFFGTVIDKNGNYIY